MRERWTHRDVVSRLVEHGHERGLQVPAELGRRLGHDDDGGAEDAEEVVADDLLVGRGGALEEREEQGRLGGREEVRVDRAEQENRLDAGDDILQGGSESDTRAGTAEAAEVSGTHHFALVLDEPVDEALHDELEAVERWLGAFLGMLGHDEAKRLVDGRRAVLEDARRLRDDARELGERVDRALGGVLGRRAEPDLLERVESELLRTGRADVRGGSS